MNQITPELIAKMQQAYASDPTAKALNAALAKTDIADVAFLPMEAARLNGEFAIEIDTHGITAQEQSGRCWMFAAMNITRETIIKKLNLGSFELSGNYLAFWDKLEKANNFLDRVIETASLEPNSREVAELFEHAIGDGGSWPNYVDLIHKYGVVPKEAMPETKQSCSTANHLAKLKEMVRVYGIELRKRIAAGEDVTERKAEMLTAFFKAECIAYGAPVEKFDFCYRDVDKEYHADFGITPKEFYEKYAGTDLDEYVYVSCVPSEKKPLNTLWKQHASCCMTDKDLTFLNLPMEEMEDLILQQMKDGEPVWFGCDSRHYGERSKGYWDPKCFSYDALLGGVDLTLSREDTLVYRNSEATHAMLFIGVNFDENGKPNRWKIENSWGKSWGMDGYFVCSQEYFETFVYEAVINKKYLNDAQKAILASEPIVLKSWEI